MAISNILHAFNRFASTISRAAGHPMTFAVAFVAILAWGISGPFFGYSEVWQLAVNTGTTIITFLMVFIIQNSQNRDGMALQIKLDEIIRAIGGAHNDLINVESLPDAELDLIHKRYCALAEKARSKLEDRRNSSQTDEADSKSRLPHSGPAGIEQPKGQVS